VGGAEYRIQRYWPRIEGLFARIERWTNTARPADCFRRSISGDGITTCYGRSLQSRIADPEEPRRVFACLICESYDGKGNAIVYEYRAEDSQDVDIAGGQKPHLLARIDNDLGTETRIFYAPSTRFYQAGRLAGRPWVTRLPFPVHVVERVETYDHVSRNRFVTRYAYHHGYFDGLEREFRGFGLVEQWDTEEFASLAEGGDRQAHPTRSPRRASACGCCSAGWPMPWAPGHAVRVRHAGDSALSGQHGRRPALAPARRHGQTHSLLGQPGTRRRLTYDALRRPTALYVREEGVERLEERTVYGEGRGEAGNHRTRVFRQYDQAGEATNLAFDLKVNLLASARRFAREYRTTLDWSDDVPLKGEVYEERTTYDALDRPVSLRSADGSVVRYHYNEASLLERTDAHLRDAATPTGFVADLDYDAKGQRERTVYDNGAVTTYDYDPLTFRLRRLRTTRNGAALQALTYTYTYDPAGNITHIRDDAQQTVYFDNAVVQPHAEHTYDAVYRLIEATGREHIGQSAALLPTSWDDGPRVRLPHAHDGQAMRRYTERYEYAALGNLLRLVHRAQGGDWTREYAYGEPSLLQPAGASNCLSCTVLGPIAKPYGHDAHGNMTSMPHLSLMRWDFDDQLWATARQAVSDGGTPETTYYVYDAAGQRLGKVTERQACPGQTPTRLREHLYLGVLEVYREYGATAPP